jgi:imidazolonepropionase-like amidohydrolase
VVAWAFDGELLDGLDPDERIVVGTGDVQPLPGRFALAGLVDAHAHPSVAVDDDGPYLAGRAHTEAMLDAYARAGVSVVRDVGGLNTVTLDLSRAPAAGRPVITAAGRFLSSPGRYFPRMYTPVTADDLLAAIRDEIEAGAEWIKIIGDFPLWGESGPEPGTLAMTYDLDTLRQAVQTAHELGARLALHSNLDASELVAFGVDSFEHGTGLTVADLDALGARGGAWTPTLSAVTANRNSPDTEIRERVCGIVERMRELLPHAVRHGVRVLAGTDVAGTIAQEIALLVEFGLTVDQALAAAGSVARDYLGIAPVGDLITYDADPRSDPSVLAAPRAVVIRGRRVV